MDKNNYIVVLVTAKDTEEAHDIADALIDQRLAACVNIAAEVDSHYRWQGKVESAQESLLIVKSRQALLPEIIKAVRKIHSYETPEIIALPIIGGNEEYLKWMERETKNSKLKS